MKPWRHLLAYLPPFSILAFLLLTNLFTRSDTLRRLLFPEKSLSISSVSPDDEEAGTEPLLISSDSMGSLSDTAGSEGDSARIFFKQAVQLTRLNRSAEARNNYLRALSINPGMGVAHFNLGILSLRQKKPSEARSRFMNALHWGLKKPVCWYNIGLTYQREDSTDGALAAYRECIRFEPGQIAARLRMAEIWLERHEPDSARVRVEEAERIQPGNPEVVLRAARVASALKDYGRALEYLDRLEKRTPGMPGTAYERARVYGLKGDDRKALALYGKIMERDPANPRVYFNIGVNLMDLGKEKDALEAYTRALQADPSYWKAAYNVGVHFLKADKPAEAAAYFSRVVQISPDRSEPRYNLGLAHLKSGNLPEARKSFELALKINPGHLESRYNLALAYLRDDNNDSAEVYFNEVLKKKSCHAKSLFNLGLIAKRRGDYKSADRYFSGAIECRQAGYPSAWYQRAICQRELGNLTEALNFARRGVMPADGNPIPANAMLLKAELLDTLGMADSARATLRTADSLSAGSLTALKELAEFYDKRKDLDHIRLIYRRILLQDPRNVGILLAAAETEEAGGNPDSAEEYYRKAAQLDNDNPDVLYRYGVLLFRSKRFDEAARHFQEAVLLAPGLPGPRLQLALIYAAENRHEEFQREFSRLRRLIVSPDDAVKTGKHLHRAGRFREALMLFQQAAADNSKDPDLKYSIAKTYLAIRDTASAREWIGRYLKQHPNEQKGKAFDEKINRK